MGKFDELGEQLKIGYVKETLTVKDDFTVPLRNAEFTWDRNGTFYAKFDMNYIIKISCIVGGAAQMYLKAKLKSEQPKEDEAEKNRMYLNEIEVNDLLEDIEYYLKESKWREATGENYSEEKKNGI